MIKKSLIACLLLALAGCGESGKAHLALPRKESSPTLAFVSVVTREALVYNLSLRIYDDDHVELVIGSRQDPEIHFREARSDRDANVRPWQYFVATDTTFQYTHVLQHSGIDRQSYELLLWDMAKSTVDRIPYDPATGTVTYTIGQVPRHITIDSLTDALAIDQDGNGTKDGALSPLVSIDGQKRTPQDLRQK